MRIRAIIKRIIQQFFRDKRSMALMMLAPLLVMTLVWLVLDLAPYEPTIAITDVPEQLETALENESATIKKVSISEAEERLENGTIDAHLLFKDKSVEITMEGSDPTATSAVQNIVKQATDQLNPPSIQPTIEFLHGSADLNLFDQTGPVLIGYFIFFFVFLIGGVSFLRERTQGTLERLLATPLKRWEIVTGYLIGFGLFIMIQSIIITAYSIYILDLNMAGSFLSVLVITFLLAMTALSLGTLLSAFSKTEFQMIQFIPIVIIPQVFFSGLFHVEQIAWINAIGKVMPLTYGARSLTEIMIRGQGLDSLMVEISVLIGFSLLFIVLNIIALKRHRAL